MKKYILILIFLFFGISVNAATLDEMIGQMILVGFHGSKATSFQFGTIKKQIKKGEIGGVILFEHNIQNPNQLTQMTYALNNLNSIYPPFIGIDQEGGMVARLNQQNGFKNHSTAYKVATTKNLQQTYRMYFDLAQMCNLAGLNLNFVPDVDLLLNPNSIIAKKERSFSSDEKIVTAYAKECLKAHYDSNMITSLKHFPGHGSPTGDTHQGFVDASKTWSEKELYPYYKLANLNDMQMVMVSHIFIDKLDNKYPASLSKEIVTELLRNKIGFKSVVITDDLHMGAIRNNYSLEDIVINSINAGNDILLFSNFHSPDMRIPKKVNKIVKKAIKDGRISQSTIENSYNRIVTLKDTLKAKKVNEKNEILK